MALVVEKAGAGIDLEAKEFTLGCLLQVDPGEEEIESLSETQASRFHGRRQDDRLELGGKAVGMGIAVVHGLGFDPGGENASADGVHTDIVTGNERLKLSRTVAEKIEAREMVGSQAADN